MKRQTRGKPRVRRKLIGDKWHHVYRVVVEKVLHQSIIVEAESQGEAENQAYDIAERHHEMWREEEPSIRDCTSVEMMDGSWEFCNALTTK